MSWAGSSFEATVRDDAESGEDEEEELNGDHLTLFALCDGLRGAVSLDLLASASGGLDTPRSTC